MLGLINARALREARSNCGLFEEGFASARPSAHECTRMCAYVMFRAGVINGYECQNNTSIIYGFYY